MVARFRMAAQPGDIVESALHDRLLDLLSAGADLAHRNLSGVAATRTRPAVIGGANDAATAARRTGRPGHRQADAFAVGDLRNRSRAAELGRRRNLLSQSADRRMACQASRGRQGRTGDDHDQRPQRRGQRRPAAVGRPDRVMDPLAA